MFRWATEYLKHANYYSSMLPPGEEHEPSARGSSVAPLLAGAGIGALGAWGLGHTELGHNLGGFLDAKAIQGSHMLSEGADQAGQFIHDHATVPLGRMARG